MLEEVVGQLLAERRLVARELFAVLRREEDAVMVRHVHARDRDHLVVLHLLRELVRQLHGLDARAEGAPERALDEPAELRLQVAQHAHPASQSSPKPWSHAEAATAPEAWSSATSAASTSPSATWAARSAAAQRPAPRTSTTSQRPRRTRGSTTAPATQARTGAAAGVVTSGPSASEAAAEIEPSQVERASVPSGEPNRSS